MDKIINFAVNLMERENMYYEDPNLLPSQNPTINPGQNPDINTSQNPKINSTQNPKIHWSQNPHWKQNQWELFKETILWEYLNDSQKEKCKRFLQSL